VSCLPHHLPAFRYAAFCSAAIPAALCVPLRRLWYIAVALLRRLSRGRVSLTWPPFHRLAWACRKLSVPRTSDCASPRPTLAGGALRPSLVTSAMHPEDTRPLRQVPVGGPCDGCAGRGAARAGGAAGGRRGGPQARPPIHTADTLISWFSPHVHVLDLAALTLTQHHC